LTALAQLATIRLKAARAIVSLIDHSHQYILTEATPTLALGPPGEPRPVGADSLWLGAVIIPRTHGLCQRALQLPFDPAHSRTRVPAVVVNDLLQDDGFDSNCIASTAPKSRFYASVPLFTDEGACIGALSILDEEPRDGLDHDSLILFQDIANMIMAYLKSCKLRADQTRGDQMIRGLTSFMNGQDHPLPETGRKNIEKVVLQENYSKEERHIRNGSEQSQRPPIPQRAISDKDERNSSPLNNSSADADKLREIMLPLDAKAMFARAAAIIRKNCNYDGVVIFDSTISTFEGQIQATANQNTNKSTDQNSTAERSPQASRRAMCHVLGFSSTNGFEHPPCAESDLHSLLDSYPTGKIYNISEVGEITVDHPATPMNTNSIMNNGLSSYGLTGVRRQKSRKRLEAETIKKIAPAARSVAFFPLYDFRKGRWFAGGFCWARDSNRILSPELDLLYLRAFGNSMMTELSRLDAISADRAKTTFVASISHELRSPLHGILGGVEVLQDTKIDDFQASMVTSIEVCGRTLLNTINHVMDFAKINAFAEQKAASERGDKAKKRPTDMSSLTSLVDLSVVLEETVETVYVGETYRTTHMANQNFDNGLTKTSHEVGRKTLHVVLDIPHRSNWRFKTQPGSWKRIVMNTFGNALKYSETGYVHVSVRFDDGDPESKDSLSEIVVIVSDSGIGISSEFLQNQLYKPFSQENSFATGTGLGLSIVRQIVESMGGSIDITSQKLVGTEVKIRLPVPEAHPNSGLSLKSKAALMKNARQQTQGRKISIFRRQISPQELEARATSITTGDTKIIESLVNTLSQWLGMIVTVSADIPPDGTDIVLSPGPSFDFLSSLRQKYPKGKVPIVLFLAVDTIESATLRADARITSEESVVEIITQP
jgi:signal transduction histidine kinase